MPDHPRAPTPVLAYISLKTIDIFFIKGILRVRIGAWKSATIFGEGTIPEPSTSHIGKGVALVAQTTAFVCIYARISQIAEMTQLPRNTGIAKPRAMTLRRLVG